MSYIENNRRLTCPYSSCIQVSMDLQWFQKPAMGGSLMVSTSWTPAYDVHARTSPLATIIGPKIAQAKKLCIVSPISGARNHSHITYSTDEAIRGVDACEHSYTNERRCPLPNPPLSTCNQTTLL